MPRPCALQDTTLVTADRTYYDKAQDEGRIVLLSQFDVSLST